MKFASKRFVVLLALLTAPAVTVAMPQAAIADKSPTVLDQPQTKSEEDFYRNVRSELKSALGDGLGEDYYTVYRIVERMARANGLDESPWRVRVTEELRVNAYASDVNMLTFEAGLLEQLDSDISAIACVVGHELAHHTQNHIPSIVATRARLEALQEEALLEARQEVEAARQNSNVLGPVVDAVTGVVTGGVNAVTGIDISPTGVFASRIIQSTMEGLNASEIEQATARAEQIYAERVAELDAEYAATLRAHESEADEVGYRYMVQAGFEPEGCIRAMSLLARLESSQLPSLSHPHPEDRLATINALNTPQNNQALVSTGQAHLSQSAKPLAVGVSRDGNALRVASRYGDQDIDDSLPQ